MTRRTEAMRGARMKTKHFLVMRKDTVDHECVWIEPKRCIQTLVK
jgi:hypothetical protein